MILDAISGNHSSTSGKLRVHTVLGDDTAATRRLKMLAKYAVNRAGGGRGFDLTEDTSLFVEDFLAVFDRDYL